MKHTLFLALLGASIGLLNGGSAHAQGAADPSTTTTTTTTSTSSALTRGDAVKPFSVRVLAARPTGSTVRDATRSIAPQIGVSYEFHDHAGAALVPRLDLDYERLAGKDNRVEPLSATVDALVPLDKRTGLEKGAYVGAGIGVADTEIKAGTTGFGTVLPNTSNSKVGFDAKIMAGYNFNSRVFGELGYNRLEKVENVDPSSLSLGVGLRF